MQNNKKILVVDDDKDFSFILKEALAEKGFNVIVAHDGKEAMSLFDKEKPDLVISDILMPRMDGVTLIRQLEEKSEKPKIIFLTNLDDSEDISKTFGLSEDDYLVKARTRIEDIVKRAMTDLNIK
jgi:OmpR family response regulator RpaB